MPTVKVHVIGPNLRDQSTGDFHVHAEGCADVKRSPNYAGSEYAFDRENTYEMDSPEAVSEFIYSDMIGEGSMTAEDGVSTIHFFPCVNFGGQS